MADISIVLNEPFFGKATVCAETVKATEWFLDNVHVGNFDGRCVIIEALHVPSFSLELDRVKLTYTLT